MEMASDWKIIATFLKIPNHIIDEIGIENRRVRDCLREILAYWLKQVNPLPCWNDLAEAAERLGNHVKAKQIRDKYCPPVK